jgi:anti-sigma B factor antagonist
MAGGCAGGEHGFTAGMLCAHILPGEEGAPAVAALEGELDIASASTFGAAVERLLTAGHDVVVDMADLRFCDSSGFAALIRARNVAHEHHRTLALRHLQPHVAKTMALVGLDKVFTVED